MHLTDLSSTSIAHLLLQQTRLPLEQIAAHAGFNRRVDLQRAVRDAFGCAPSGLRQARGQHQVSFSLSLPQPYDIDWMAAYLQRRLLPQLEAVTYQEHGWQVKRLLPGPDGLMYPLHVRLQDQTIRLRLPLQVEPLHRLLRRVVEVFDLSAPMDQIEACLTDDPTLRTLIKERPGLRVPGAWDHFELVVRAILGQQVSVERGTELANRMIERYGGGTFPRPEQLVEREIAELGMPGRRGQAISQFARYVSQHPDWHLQGAEGVYRLLVDIPGIGPWTANYVLMRAVKHADAFLDNDWVVLKVLDTTAARARRAALPWQPWRSYAVMYLWHAAGSGKELSPLVSQGGVS